MEESDLENLIKEGYSTREIAKETGKSQTTIRYWLNKFNLKTCSQKRKKRRKKLNPIRCKFCGTTDPERFYQRTDTGGRVRTRCKNCHNKYSIERLRKLKQQAIDYKGGNCVRCGYNRCQASLVFHHRDPEKKDPNWRRMRSWCLDRIKKELDKCDLLCRNCHGEVHYEISNKKSEA